MTRYINYNGEKWPVRMVYSVFKRIQKDRGKSADLSSQDIEMNEYMLFYALQKGCEAENIEMPFKFEDMEAVLDECFWEFQKIIQEFRPPEDEEPGQEKKKEGKGSGK